MTTWLTSLRDRPIAESERTTAMATVSILMVAAAILLVLARPNVQPGYTPQRAPGASVVVQSTPSVIVRTLQSRAAPLPPKVTRATGLFLAGYLDYLYGHAPARQIKDISPVLLRSLRANPPRVSPEMQTRRPRVTALHRTPAPPGLFRVSAVINDGSLVDYSIRLRLAPQDERMLVVGLEDGE